MKGTLDTRAERKIDRLLRDIEDLSDTLQDFTSNQCEETLLAIEMRDLLDELSYDDDLPVFRRNQARDLVRRVDAEMTR